MPEAEDIRWLRNAANELNNLLQVIAESSHALQPICEKHPGGEKYYAFLRTSLERAIGVSTQLATRIGPRAEESIPEPPASTAVSVPAAPAAVIVNPDGPRELILIIDDEEMIGTLASEMLVNEGYRVTTALDPFRALAVFRELQDQIALVILDFTLPIMDGSEVFDELRKLRPDVAVMLSSGFAEQEKVRTMLAKGLRGFLPKPYTEQKLLTQVRIVLDSIHSQRTGERRVL